jgi:ABC-2 type transport system permease protein
VASAAVWFQLVGARFRAELQYRTSFALIVASTTVFSFLDFVAVLAIFDRVDALGGWAFAEVALLYGTATVAFHLANVFVGGIDSAAEQIRLGTFDRLLLRPLGTVVQLVAGGIVLPRLGRLVQASMVLTVAVASIDRTWSAVDALALVVLVVSGAAIFGSVWVMIAAIGFWTVDNRGIGNTFTYAASYFTQYPLDVFTGWLRQVALVLPYAFVSYLPVARILDKDPAYDLPSATGLASPLVAIVLAILAGAVWRFGVRHHRSTGS